MPASPTWSVAREVLRLFRSALGSLRIGVFAAAWRPKDTRFESAAVRSPEGTRSISQLALPAKHSNPRHPGRCLQISPWGNHSELCRPLAVAADGQDRQNRQCGNCCRGVFLAIVIESLAACG